MPKHTPKKYYSKKDFKRLLECYKNDAENYEFIQNILKNKEITIIKIIKLNKLWKKI